MITKPLRYVRRSATGISLWMVTVTFSLGLLADSPPSAVGPMMRLFQSGRLPPERTETVVEMICKRGNEHDLQVVLDRLLQPAGFPPDLQIKTMAWLTEAATTRKVRPAGELGRIAPLILGEAARADSRRQRAAIRLASAWNDRSIGPALSELAQDTASADDLRREAIAGLVAIGDDQSRTTLARLAAPPYPVSIRMQAAGGLASVDLAQAATLAATALADATPQDDPGSMLDAFFERQAGADQLAQAIAEQTLPAEVAKQALRYMYSVGRSDMALSDTLSKAAGIATDTPPPTPAEVAAIVADVGAKGDPVRGEQIFRRKDLNCMKCHSVNRAGGQIGPELSAVGGSSPTDYIVNSILNPNLAVKEQYATHVFFLNSGKSITGVVVDRDEVQVNVRDVHGNIIKVPVADIEEEAPGQTLMPQGLTRFLTRDELLDLARFVSELGKPGPYTVSTAKTIQRWRVLRSPSDELTAEIPHLEHIRQHVLGSDLTAWDAAYGMVSGYLPLNELRKGIDAQVLYLQGEVEVHTAGNVSIMMEATVPYTAWLDDSPLQSVASTDVAITQGRHRVTVRVELGEASNASAAAETLRVEFRPVAGDPVQLEVVGGN